MTGIFGSLLREQRQRVFITFIGFVSMVTISFRVGQSGKTRKTLSTASEEPMKQSILELWITAFMALSSKFSCIPKLLFLSWKKKLVTSLNSWKYSQSQLETTRFCYQRIFQP
jgi:hypothetical protein